MDEPATSVSWNLTGIVEPDLNTLLLGGENFETPYPTVKLRTIGVAACQTLVPGWLAVMLQVPAAPSVTVVPVTVHTVEVEELNVTGSPEEAVALTVDGPEP